MQTTSLAGLLWQRLVKDVFELIAEVFLFPVLMWGWAGGLILMFANLVLYSREEIRTAMDTMGVQSAEALFLGGMVWFLASLVFWIFGILGALAQR